MANVKKKITPTSHTISIDIPTGVISSEEDLFDYVRIIMSMYNIKFETVKYINVTKDYIEIEFWRDGI